MFQSSILAMIAQLVFAAAAMAQQTTPPSGEEWYKVATSIIAIPAGILGVIISWNMVRKTRLETRKLELDIDEKQNTLLRARADADNATSQLIAIPFSDNQRALLLIVRFVLLELTLRIWEFVPDVVTTLFTAAGAGVFFLLGSRNPNIAAVTASLIPAVVPTLLSIVYWIIVFGFGWPLFKDTCSFLNIPIKSLLDVPKIGQRRNY